MDKTPTQWMIEPLRRYAQFSGRARRAEYWWFWLLRVGVGIAAAVVDLILGLRPVGVANLVLLAFAIPDIAVAVRRLHDLGRSGWLLLAPFLTAVALVAVIGAGAVSAVVTLVLGLAMFAIAILLLVWFCSRGTVGPNRFGPDPLAFDDSNTVALI